MNCEIGNEYDLTKAIPSNVKINIPIEVNT